MDFGARSGRVINEQYSRLRHLGPRASIALEIKVKCDLRPRQKAAIQAFAPRFRSRDCRRSRPIHLERLGMLGRNILERLGMLLDRSWRSRCSRKTIVFEIDRNAAGAGVRLVDALSQISPHRF